LMSVHINYYGIAMRYIGRYGVKTWKKQFNSRNWIYTLVEYAISRSRYAKPSVRETRKNK
jgi:hypothetical protein